LSALASAKCIRMTACTVIGFPLYPVRHVSKSLKVAKTVPHEVVAVLTQANPKWTVKLFQYLGLSQPFRIHV